jgi:hypothetical protein
LLWSASLMTKRAWSRAISLASPARFTESSTASKSLQARTGDHCPGPVV